MKKLSALLATSITLLVPALCRGGPTETAIMAAMKLAEKPNYSWHVTVMDDAQVYDIEGKTKVPTGWTWVRLPMVDAVARRLGREATPDLEAVFKGSTASVIHTDRGWRKLDELPRWEPVIDEEFEKRVPPVSYANIRARAAWEASGGDLTAGDPFGHLPLPVPTPAPQAYSNVQYGVSRPHEELAIIVSSFADMKVQGDVVEGRLTDQGARLLLVRDGQDDITPLAAAGVFKLQLKNGMVSSYVVQLEGILAVRKKKVHVHQTSNTVITNVGTTKFDVPIEVEQKLARE